MGDVSVYDMLTRMEHVTSTALLDNTATSTTNIFDFTGQIEVLRITGIIETTAMEAQQTQLKLTYNPDSGGENDMCAVLDCTGDGVGTFYEIDGTPANALIATAPHAAPAACKQTGNYHLACQVSGTISVNNADAANDGQVQWSICWRGLSADATVAAS